MKLYFLMFGFVFIYIYCLLCVSFVCVFLGGVYFYRHRKSVIVLGILPHKSGQQKVR